MFIKYYIHLYYNLHSTSLLSYHNHILNIYYTGLSAVPVLLFRLEENPKMLGPVLQFRCETQTVSVSNKTHCCQLSALHKPSEF